MLRNAASKALWVLKGAALFGGAVVTLALVLGVASMAFGANGQPFVLGQNNTATLLTKLTGNVQGSAMQVQNSNAGTDDTALSLRVEQGEAPMRVNSAGKVLNLNADRLDGKDFGAFDADELIDGPGPLPISEGLTSEGGLSVFSISGSGFRDSDNSRFSGAIAMDLLVDGQFVDRLHLTTNLQDYHAPFVAEHAVREVPAGPHTVRLEAVYSPDCDTDNETFAATNCASTNANDHFSLTVLEIPD